MKLFEKNLHLAADTSSLLLGECRQCSDLGGDDGLGQGVLPPEQGRLGLGVAQDWLKDSEQRFGQHVRQVVHRVDRDVVLQHVDGILKK
jgi:hypothetical protein